MKNKKAGPEQTIQQARSHTLQAVRQQLRNKLIEVGLNCNQIKQQYQTKRTMDKKAPSLHRQNNNLPVIFSLKNSLAISKEENIKFAQEVFSQRQRLIESQSSSPKNGTQLQNRRQRQSLSFREQFQRKMIEEVKLYKMEKIFPNLRKSLRKEKLRTEANQTIVIRALHQHKPTEVLYITPTGKQKNTRSKTEQHRLKEFPPKNKVPRMTQYKQLCPWEQTAQGDNWLHKF